MGGFEYFLEVSLAKEVLSVFGARQPTDAERCRLLLYYAMHDAYPDWVYPPDQGKDARSYRLRRRNDLEGCP